MKSNFFKTLAAASGIAALVHGIYAYFLRSFNPAIRQMFDGYDRQISPAPFPFSLLYLVGDGAWPGFGWMVVDWVVFFGLIFLAMHFLGMASSAPQTQPFKDNSRSA